MASYRRDSNVGDWAAVVKELHGAYTDSKMREMNYALEKLKLESQGAENELARKHDFSLLDKRKEHRIAEANTSMATAPENQRFQKWTQNDDGTSALDEEATLLAINEHSRFSSVGANLASSTFTKANAYYSDMPDFSPSYTTEEDVLVLDNYMEDHIYNNQEPMSNDEYLKSMGVLEAGETYTSIAGTGGQKFEDKVGVDRETLSRRYNSFKEGLRKNSSIYKDTAEYNEYLASNTKDDFELASALTQTEEYKNHNQVVSNVASNLKGILSQYGKFKVNKKKTGYELKDTAWATESVIGNLVLSTQPEVELDKILRMKTSDGPAWKEYVEKMQAEEAMHPGIYAAVNQALENRRSVLKINKEEAKSVRTAINSKQLRLREAVLGKLQTGKADNIYKGYQNQFYNEAKLILSSGGGKEEINALMEQYKGGALSRSARNSILIEIGKEL